MTSVREAPEPRRWAALAALCLAVLLVTIDGEVLFLALPLLTQQLRPSSIELLWISDAYSFTLAGLLVTMGSLGDRIGRKRLLLVGSAGFALTSVLAAYADNPGRLIVARVLLGVAGATILPTTLSIIRNLFTDARERTTAIGVWSAMFGAGLASGPIVGGALLEHFWWGSVFLINLPVTMGLLVAGGVLLPESRDPRPGRLDPLSAALSLLGITGVVLAIKQTAVSAAIEPLALAAALLGGLALAAFVRRQRTLDTPLIDVALFRDRSFRSAVLVNMVAVFALSGLLFFLSPYFQLVRGYGPLQAGVAELPATVGAIVAAVLAGRLVMRAGPATLVAVGLGLSAVALTAMSAIGLVPTYLLVGGSLAALGAGVGLSLTITSDLILAAAPKEKAGAAAAVSETSLELGAALGIALLGSVLTAVYRAELRLPAGLPDQLRETAQDYIGSAVAAAAAAPAGLGPGVLSAARDAFVTAMSVTALICAALVFVSALLARALPHRVPEAVSGAAEDHEPQQQADVSPGT